MDVWQGKFLDITQAGSHQKDQVKKVCTALRHHFPETKGMTGYSRYAVGATLACVAIDHGPRACFTYIAACARLSRCLQ
jgi:Spy/CpxP family protein refolding chaperone